ncbi:MAG: CoA transferase [Pseudomonadota bacterium]
MRALDGVTVLDLTHMLSGPYAGQLLADLGARVVKIEPPERGEATRRLLQTSPDYSKGGMGAYFMTLNRNKSSVALDLKSERGLEIFHGLVAKADIVLNNFAAGVPARLKIDHATLFKINPRIITCSITGFGETGPGVHRTAFDLVAQGMGGGMAVTGEPDGPPLRSGIPIGDLGGGLFGVIGVLSALQARSTTGRGQHVDISMADCQLSLLGYMGTMTMMSGKPPGRLGNGHFVHAPYNVYATATEHMIIAVIFDTHWPAVVEALGDPALADPKFDAQPGRLAHKAFIDERVQARLATRPRAHWLETFERLRVPCAPVHDIEAAFADPQAAARNMVVDVPLPNGEITQQPGNPVKLSDTYEDHYAPAPELGAQTDAVLAEFLGLDEAALADLAAEGVVGRGEGG